MIFAGLAGAIIWTVTTWYAGIPSSSSHALIGGVVGAMLADKGSMAVQWNGVFSNVLFPAILAIAVTGVVAAVATWLALRITDDVDDKPRAAGFRLAQKGSASMIALAHGTNDAQKTMGIITLALIANNTISSTTQTPPLGSSPPAGRPSPSAPSSGDGASFEPSGRGSPPLSRLRDSPPRPHLLRPSSPPRLWASHSRPRRSAPARSWARASMPRWISAGRSSVG